MKYKVIESTVEYLKGIEFDFDQEVLIGETINILGQVVSVTQAGGGVIAGASQDNVMVIQQVIE